MKTDLFQSCDHCWVFQICWHIECSTLTALSFRIWDSSTGISSSPLALFIVVLPKTHLASHSRMSGSRSVITPLWLSGSWRSFCIVLYVNYNLALTKSIANDKAFAICLCWDWTPCCYAATTPEGVQGGVRHPVLQGIWWDRSLDRQMVLGKDFMISVLAFPHI